jgi:hypothetical protein
MLSQSIYARDLSRPYTVASIAALSRYGATSNAGDILEGIYAGIGSDKREQDSAAWIPIHMLAQALAVSAARIYTEALEHSRLSIALTALVERHGLLVAVLAHVPAAVQWRETLAILVDLYGVQAAEKKMAACANEILGLREAHHQKSMVH